MRTTTRILALVTAAVLAATGAGVAAPFTDSDDISVVAEFADASPLLVGNEVKTDGAPIGEVEKMEVADGRARVTLRIEARGLPVHDDARATIRPVSLLGERFVDLDRGTPERPALEDGAVIGVANTTTNTDLDQILNSVDDPTGESLALLVTTLGEGMRGNGGNADEAIRALAPALTDTEGFVDVLNEQNALLNGLVDRVTPVAESLAADRGAKLDALVGSADGLLAATAEKQAELDATIAELPATLASARTTLDHLGGTARSATPTLAAMRPTTDDLAQISDELLRFSDSLDPALATAKPVLDRGTELLDAARPVVADLRRAGPNLRATTAGARPVVEELSGNLDNVFGFIRFWAMTTNGHDGLSNWFRTVTVVNPDSLTGALPPGTAPALPDTGALTEPLGPVGDAAGGLLAPPPGAGAAPEPADAPPAGDGATGLDQEQESSMLGSLLGGGS